MNDEFSKSTFGCIGLVVVAVLASMAQPLIYTMAGYFTGWVLSSLFEFAGQWIVAGAQAFGMEIQTSQLPVIGAFLGFVSAFFRLHNSNSSSK